MSEYDTLNEREYNTLALDEVQSKHCKQCVIKPKLSLNCTDVYHHVMGLFFKKVPQFKPASPIMFNEMTTLGNISIFCQLK